MQRKLVETNPAESGCQYQDISVLILSEDVQKGSDQIRLFQELGIQADFASDMTEVVKRIHQTETAGEHYDFVIINQSQSDRSGIQAVKQLLAAASWKSMTCVLAAEDMVSVDKSTAVDSGMTAFVQVPLFRSTACSIFDRTYELHGSLNTDSVIQLDGKRILLVEDNDMNRQIALTLIRETRADVVEASNGKEAVSAFKENEEGYFDVILMDVQMPLMNGYEATAAIRSIQRKDAKIIPIYAMAANTFDEDVRQVKEAGMNGHLGKPYIPSELYELLERAVSS